MSRGSSGQLRGDGRGAAVLRLLLPLLVCLLASAGHAQRRSQRITMPPPEVAMRGEPIPIELSLAGWELGEDVEARLHYRPQGTPRFAEILLEPVGESRWQGEIPAEASTSLAVLYYVVASTPDGQWQLALGSQQQPFRLRLGDPPPPPVDSSLLLKASLVSIPLLALAGFLWWRERQQRRILVDQVFWARTLFPLLNLKGTQRSAEVTRLAARPLDHPLYGARRFRRVDILRKLNDLRSWDIRSLATASGELLGEDLGLGEVTADASAPVLSSAPAEGTAGPKPGRGAVEVARPAAAQVTTGAEHQSGPPAAPAGEPVAGAGDAAAAAPVVSAVAASASSGGGRKWQPRQRQKEHQSTAGSGQAEPVEAAREDAAADAAAMPAPPPPPPPAAEATVSSPAETTPAETASEPVQARQGAEAEASADSRGGAASDSRESAAEEGAGDAAVEQAVAEEAVAEGDESAPQRAVDDAQDAAATSPARGEAVTEQAAAEAETTSGEQETVEEEAAVAEELEESGVEAVEPVLESRGLLSIARVGRWIGAGLAAGGATGAAIFLLWTGNLTAAGWAGFASVYGLAVWHSSRDTLDRLGS